MKWTNDEICFLKENFEYAEIEFLCFHLNKKWKNIFNKGSSIGLKRKTVDIWSKDDELELIKVFPYMSKPECEKKFKRTWRNIARKAYAMNLRRNNRKWSSEEIEILKLIYWDYSWEDILSYFPNRTKKQILSKAEKIGIQRSKNKYDL